MKTLRIRDIMTPEVKTLPAAESAEEAARRLCHWRVGGAPVIDRGRIVGVLSKSDLVDPQNRPSEDGQPTVDAVMTPLVYAVRPSDPAMLAVRLMAEEGIHRVVVVDQGGKLAGIVSTMDVIRALAKGEQVLDFVEAEGQSPEHAEPAVAVQYVDLRSFELTDS